MNIRVLLVDDHAVLRSGLAMLVNAQPDLEVVGEAGDGLEAVERAKTLQPDVVVLDLSMGPHSGLGAIAELRRVHADAKVLVLSMHSDASYVRMALAAGASGYVAKGVAHAELLTAIRAVSQGRMFVDLALAHQSHGDSARPDGDWDRASPASAPVQRLSPREGEVLHRVAQGYTNAQIAEQLSLSVKSVETYRARLSEKLGVRTRAELVRFAVGSGLLTPERIVQAE